jgi:hypothetical protein
MQVPLLVLYGAEVFLAIIGARIAFWVLRGWSAFRAGERSPDGPGGPDGGRRMGPGLQALEGGAAPAVAVPSAVRFRAAA